MLDKYPRLPAFLLILGTTLSETYLELVRLCNAAGILPYILTLLLDTDVNLHQTSIRKEILASGAPPPRILQIGLTEQTDYYLRGVAPSLRRRGREGYGVENVPALAYCAVWQNAEAIFRIIDGIIGEIREFATQMDFVSEENAILAGRPWVVGLLETTFWGGTGTGALLAIADICHLAALGGITYTEAVKPVNLNLQLLLAVPGGSRRASGHQKTLANALNALQKVRAYQTGRFFRAVSIDGQRFREISWPPFNSIFLYSGESPFGEVSGQEGMVRNLASWLFSYLYLGGFWEFASKRVDRQNKGGEG